jgi:hypothetical protein
VLRFEGRSLGSSQCDCETGNSLSSGDQGCFRMHRMALTNVSLQIRASGIISHSSLGDTWHGCISSLMSLWWSSLMLLLCLLLFGEDCGSGGCVGAYLSSMVWTRAYLFLLMSPMSYRFSCCGCCWRCGCCCGGCCWCCRYCCRCCCCCCCCCSLVLLLLSLLLLLSVLVLLVEYMIQRRNDAKLFINYY